MTSESCAHCGQTLTVSLGDPLLPAHSIHVAKAALFRAAAFCPGGKLRTGALKAPWQKGGGGARVDWEGEVRWGMPQWAVHRARGCRWQAGV